MANARISNGLSRRQAITGCLAAAVGGTAKAAEVDPHVAWEAERQVIRAQIDALYALPDDLCDANYEAYERQLGELFDLERPLFEQISTTPPRTPEGAAIQLRLWLEENRRHYGAEWVGELDIQAYGHVLGFLERAG